MKLAKNLERLGTESAFSILAEAKKLEAQGKEMIHLGLGQPDFKSPKHVVDAAKKAKSINKIYVSSDSKFILNRAQKKGCSPIVRPSYLCSDKALLEDAIQHAVNFCQKENNNKIKNFVILLCNSICVTSNDIEEGFELLKKEKKFRNSSEEICKLLFQVVGRLIKILVNF